MNSLDETSTLKHDVLLSTLRPDTFTPYCDHVSGAVIGSVCHGALGLIHAHNEHGAPLVEGRRVCGVTDQQIKDLGQWDTLPFHPELELRRARADFRAKKGTVTDFFSTHVEIDGQLVTGQNQNSACEVGAAILEVLASL